MPAIDLSATPYYSMVISLAKSPLFSIAIHPMSVVHYKKVNRLRQVCHHWPSSCVDSVARFNTAIHAGDRRIEAVFPLFILDC